MKTQPLFLALLLGFLPLFLKAQSTNVPDQIPPPPSSGGHGPMANLSNTDRAKVKAAHDKAIKQDPELDQKMKAAHQTMEEAKKSMHDAMIAVDPSVEPILAKMMPPKWAGKHESGQGGPNSQRGAAAPSLSTNTNAWQHLGRHEPAGMANLTESERQQLKSLHEQVKNDPAVIAAKQAKRSATNPEARHAAEESMHQVINDAIIKADPSVEAILEKLHPSGGTGGGGAGQPSASPSAMPMAM
jgi:Spy/CpxP family protein refolding chaperone